VRARNSAGHWGSASRDTGPATFGLRRARSARLGRGDVLANRYRLGGELGRGAVGTVFRAHDLATQTQVALKVVHPEIAGRRSWLGRLGREVQHARDVQHINVCRIFELVESDGYTFFTMELAAGGALRQTLVRKPRRPVAERMADARAVTAGLAAIHAAGIVHRDLKPENILRMRDGRLVVSDFGVAEQTASHGHPRPAGTPGYIAPEVVRGGAPGLASDIWALGVVMSEILFGCRPEAAGAGRMAAQAAALRELCLACTATDPAMRPSNAGHVLATLDELDGETLDRRLSRGPLSIAAALSLAARLLEAAAAVQTRSGGRGVITPARVFVPRRPDAPLRLLDSPAEDGSARESEAAYAAERRLVLSRQKPGKAGSCVGKTLILLCGAAHRG
jgi:serine/threonine protein kinase